MTVRALAMKLAEALLASLVAVAAVAADSPAPWVSMGADGLLKYRADEKGNRIPDFSMVGYGTGNHALPDVQARLALKSAGGDQTARIHAALDALAKLPPAPGGFRGALLLLRGEYRVSGTLRIRASGIVLRGERQDSKTGTVIRDTGKDKDPLAKTLLVESPPGARNWAIGCKAGAFSSSGPERGLKRGAGEFESNNQPVAIRSLYGAQFVERMRTGR